MALIGTVAVAEGNGAGAVVTSSKTSTAGSLVVGGGATWHSSEQNVNVTSSLAGTYTEASQITVVDGVNRITYSLYYNVGGTRGASHTLTVAPTSVARSVSWQEFDTIATSPTVTVGSSASGTSTGPSCSVTVPSGDPCTVIAIMTYAGSSTTATVADGTQIAEADENSDNQAHFTAAKFGQSPGSVTITWTLAASRLWSCYAIAVTETAAAGGQPAVKRMGGVQFGPGFAQGVSGVRGW